MAITADVGGGNWNAGATWVGGVVPTSADDVLLTVTSGAVTINAAAACRSLDCTGYVSTLTHNDTIVLSVGDGTTGHFKLAAGMTYTISGGASNRLSFVSTTTGNEITTAGKSMPGTTFNGATGAWKLMDNWTTFSSSASVVLTDGDLDLNGKTLQVGIWNSSNSNTRSVTFNGGALTVIGSGINAFVHTTTTNLTWTQDTGILTMSGGTGSATSFLGGAFASYGEVRFTGSGISSVSGANTFTTLTRTGTAAKTDEWTFDANQTISGTLTINGNSSINRMLVRSNALGTARTLTAATVSVSNSDFRDITGAGAGSWNLSAITGLSGDALGNSGITFTGAGTQYWVGGTGNWDASGEWASTSGGAGGSGRVPLPQDSVRFDANSFSAGGQTVTSNMPRKGTNLDWTGATNSPTLTINTAGTIYGSLTRIAGVTYSTAVAMTFEGRGSHTITSAGSTFAASVTFAAVGGTYTLADAFSHTSSGSLTLTAGTLNDGGFTIATRAMTISGTATRALTLTGTLTNTGVSACMTATTVTGLTLTASASTITFSDTTTSKTFSGATGLVWGKLNTAANDVGGLLVTGAMTFSDVVIGAGGAGVVNFNSAMTFSTLTVGEPKSIRFKNGNTTTCNGFIKMQGSPGNLITIDTDSAGAAGTLSSSFYMHQFNYISVRDITVTGTAKWYAGWNSTNTSNNSGWQLVAGGTAFNSAGGYFGPGF